MQQAQEQKTGGFSRLAIVLMLENVILTSIGIQTNSCKPKALLKTIKNVFYQYLIRCKAIRKAARNFLPVTELQFVLTHNNRSVKYKKSKTIPEDFPTILLASLFSLQERGLYDILGRGAIQ